MIQSTTCARACESHAQSKGALKIFDTSVTSCISLS